MASDRYVVLDRNPATAQSQLQDLKLDLLFFADVGMDALTSTLAFLRMAPIQCVTWGHPDTTGSPAIDYFISSQLLELPHAHGHYSEQLVTLPLLATYYERPQRQWTATQSSLFSAAKRPQRLPLPANTVQDSSGVRHDPG